MLRTVLLVDDDRAFRETLSRDLEAEGYVVVEAADGRSAIDLTRALQPDIVLLDLALPDIEGQEVCRTVRAESAIPILVVTSRSSEIDKIVTLEIGADDYVTKPFGFRELVARIRALVRRAEMTASRTIEPRTRHSPAPLIALGRVRVDLAGHRLVRDGETVHIKPKALELLVYLMRNVGQVLTREQLLVAVWGYDYPGATRTVDTHIYWLREQIEDDAADPAFIQTVRGVGYVLRRIGETAAVEPRREPVAERS